MKVRVDPIKCISCGLCIETCPEIFEWGNDKLARAKVEQVLPELEACVREASENCPTEAIPIEE